MEDPSSAFGDQVLMEEDDDSEVEKVEVPKFVFDATHEAKLGELLHMINSVEIKLCADAAKEFIRLLRGDAGGAFLRLYVHTSSNLSELKGAWKLRQGKPGLSYILSLISVILSHPDGIYKPNDKERVSVSRILDKFAQSLIEEKLEVVYKELNSKEGKLQNAVLLLMASIVRRGSGLASEVAKNFNFKLQAFTKLAEYKKRQNDKKRKHSTRKAFVGFAMSFLEVGKPGLLRWVLQQKEMYSGVLRGLGNDDDEMITFVLSTLRDKVLTTHSLVPPGLRSVLFGSVTLEQLVGISARENGGPAAQLAHSVLVMVCTDPSNGLMPDLRRHPTPLRGNPNRLLGLMKKLKAAEIGYHRDLLLAIVKGSPPIGSAYMEEFPYNLEDYGSPTWFGTVSLAANLISSVRESLRSGFLDFKSRNLLDTVEFQSVMSCISPRPFSRSAINKGLLHSDFLVKNGTLRLLWEELKLLDSFFNAINLSCSGKQMTERWLPIKQEIQNEVRTLLPDPQVLLTLLSSLNSCTRIVESCLKRTADKANIHERGDKNIKKLKADIVDEDTDIVVGGISSAPGIDLPADGENAVDIEVSDDLDRAKDFMNVMSELWGSDLCPTSIFTLVDGEMFFHSKLVDALKIYLLTMPAALEGSFDFFMNLLSNPVALPSNLQHSLLSLLVEYVGWSPRGGISNRTPSFMYKHLQSFINLLIFSPISDVKVQAYNLARAAMSSTGAFDRNLHEIIAWLMFLPGYSNVKSSFDIQGIEVLQSLSPVVISFLCDAVSTIGNSLFRYWDVLRDHTCHLKEFQDVSPDFSPLVICILQKCVRLVNSASGNFSLPEKSTISMYVCNTLKYLLQTQVDARLLASLIRSILSEGLRDGFSLVDDSVDFICEWRPLKNLILFVEKILHQQTCYCFPVDQNAIPVDSSFAKALGEVRKMVEGGYDVEISGLRNAFWSAVICTTSGEILKDFPLVMSISQRLQVLPSFLAPIVLFEQSFLARVSKLWPKVFFSGLEMAASMISPEGMKDNAILQESILSVDFDASESAAAVALCRFLRQAPFHILFPAIISIDIPYSVEPSKIKEFLLAKLSETTSDFVVSYMRLLLFWFHQIQSTYRMKPSSWVEQCAEICYILINNVLAQLLFKYDFEFPITVKVPLLDKNIEEVAETMFCHPAVKASLNFPLGCNEDFADRNLDDSLEVFLGFSRQIIHKIDYHVLDMLTATLACLLAPLNVQRPILENDAFKQLMKTFDILVQRLYRELRKKFDMCTRTEDPLPLLQSFYALHALIQYTSPFEFLELVHWMFDRVSMEDMTGQKACRTLFLSIGFCMAADGFRILSTYLQHPVIENAPFSFFRGKGEKGSDVIIEHVYVKLCKFAINFDIDSAYVGLLEAVNAVHKQKDMGGNILHPLSLVLSRVVMGTPLDIVSHCIYGPNRTKAKLLFLLMKISPLHLSVFGQLFSEILNDDGHRSGKLAEDNVCLALSDEDFVLLLPAALLYFNSIPMKFEKWHSKHFANIPSFYSSLLLTGFNNWKSFVSGYLFQDNYDNFIPSSLDELVKLVNCSLLGKAIHMLHCYFTLNGNLRMEGRLKLFNCAVSGSVTHDAVLDCDVGEMETHLPNQALNLINRVVAKISFCRLLLFPKDNEILPMSKEADGNLGEILLEANKEGQSKMRLIKILVCSWQCVVKKFVSVSDDSMEGKLSDCVQLYRYLELFILNTILELVTEMQLGLIQLQSIPFLEQLVRSSLLYRFEDPTTLRIVRSILTLLSDGKFSCSLYLQLLLAHSQFAPTFQSLSESFNSQTGGFFRPLSGILKLLAIPHTNSKNDLQTTKQCMKQLEIIKLLRVLVLLNHHQTGSHSGDEIGINLKELYLLLLFSYGATLSEIDMEIYNLMNEIECIDISVSEEVAGMDYLWGSAALKIRKERFLDQDIYSNGANDVSVKEHRRSQFRENLPVDPKICATTVLHFPYDRTVSDGHTSLNRLELLKLKDMCETHVPGVENIQQYDPVFILHFSIHTLASGYIEPIEFAGLGLLAVALISISSPDVGMRKLGYEFLGRYKDALEKCQKKKDIIRLRLLLTYLQNGIEEPWQRVPSVIAIFAAESSFILLDSSNNYYTTLSKHLMSSSRVNLKSIPLFHTLFQSNSVNFRMERLWMLRLVWAGLNLDDDAQIFVRNSVIETLLSFYASPFSDNESKEIIVQILKKSIKLHKMARYLVEQCGLLPWLSSILSTFSGVLNENDESFLSQQLVGVIEVVSDVVSLRNIIEWLQNHALEQLMELTSQLYKLLVDGLKLKKENVALVNSVLWIMLVTLKISQKRKIFQPHFTLSFRGLIQIYQAVDVCNTEGSTANAERGLQAILMSTPPVDIFCMNEEKLLHFLMWAVSTALKSDSGQAFYDKESHGCLTIISEEAPYEESLISKLLRWLVASVILGKISGKLNDINTKFSKSSSTVTLLSLLEYFEKENGKCNKSRFDCEEVLASMIIYLQQLLGVNCLVLPSVVSALCLLLFSDASKYTDFMIGYRTHLVSLWSRIRYPTEVNQSWRWSYYQPWKDLSFEPSDTQKIDECHACQTLMVILSNVVGKKSLGLQALSHEDVEKSGVFEWEKHTLENDI